MPSEEIDELEEKIDKKRKKEPDEVIEIRHTREKTQGDLQAQLEAEKKRREELELVVEAEAMKTFMNERDRLLESVPESRREKIKDFIGDDPEKMQQVRATMLLQGQDFEDDDEDEESEVRVPKGRAKLPDYLQNEGRTVRTATYDNPTIQQYSELYRIIRDPKSSAEQKAEAEQILDETFAEIRKGLRTRSKNNPYQLPTGVVSHCMKCGHVVEMDLGKGAPCPHCGHRFGIDDFPRNPKFVPQ